MGITVRIPRRIHEAIKRLALIDGRSVREFTRLLFSRIVEEKVKEGALPEEFLEAEPEEEGEDDGKGKS